MLSASVSKPIAPALAATSRLVWRQRPVSPPAALASCRDPALCFGLIDRF